MTACCVQKVPNVRFPHFLLSACPIILFIAGQIRTRRNLVAGEVTARAPRHYGLIIGVSSSFSQAIDYIVLFFC